MDKEAIARELLAAEISAENHRTATSERGLSHGLVQDAVALRTGGDWPVTVNGEVARRAIIAALDRPTAILALQSSERGEGLGPVADWETKIAELYNWTGSKFLSGEKYNKAAADLDRGQLYGWLCGLGGYLMAARDATLSPAEPSPESREDFYANLYARSCGDVLRVRAETIEECAKVAEAAQLEFSTRPWVEPYNDGCKDAASAIRALSAPAHD